jgi:hypothetical protein
MAPVETSEGAASGRAARPAVRRLVDRSEKVTDATVRKFGLVVLVGFAAIGAIARWRLHPQTALGFWIAGGAIAAAALAAPRAVRPFRDAWMRGAAVLGRINTTILITAFYVVAVVPLGLLFKLLGRDSMRRGLDRGAKSYWEPKELAREPRRYFDQY